MLQERGYDLVTMAEAERRILSGDARRKFANLSFDDGYRDTFEVAFPVFASKRVPMTLYVTTGFIDGQHFPWWDGLEHLLRVRDRIEAPWPDGAERLETRTTAQKEHAFDTLRARIMRMPRASQETHRSSRRGLQVRCPGGCAERPADLGDGASHAGERARRDRCAYGKPLRASERKR